MEGRTPLHIKEKIEYEINLYEGFLDGLAKKIGSIPSNVQKTFTAATDVLKFIYNVISDKTGANLKKAIEIIVRNAKALYQRMKNAVAKLGNKIKQALEPIIEWLDSKIPSFFTVKSDVDDGDEVKGEGGNWKKFLLMFLGGCLLIAIMEVPNILKRFGEDTLKDGLRLMLKSTKDITAKLLLEPKVAAVATGGAAISTIMLPLIKIYAGAKILQNINDELLNSNAWLKKSK
tara:strand:+ start:101 stop:796 length:696 start_codon:yes stop_codon:yes gene_type:complete